MDPDVPSRPKFSWDLKSASWTDARGPQEGFFDAVKLWNSFHDILPETNVNEIPSSLQGIMIKSQLYGRAVDICKKVSNETVMSPDGAMAIARAIHRCDRLSATASTYARISVILLASREASETFESFESRFDGLVCGFSSAALDAKLSESLIAFALTANAGLEGNQITSILSAAVHKSDESGTNETSEYLKKITSENVASIFRSFDKPAVGPSRGGSYEKSLAASPAKTRHQPKDIPKGPKYTYNQAKNFKRNPSCKACNEKGHWAGDPESEMSKKNGYNAKTDDENRNLKHTADGSSVNANSNPRALTFGMVTMTPSDDDLYILVDDGAPYSGIGKEELTELRQTIMSG